MKARNSVKGCRPKQSKLASEINFERTLEWARLHAAHLGGADACAKKHCQVLVAKGETKERLNQLTVWRQSTAFTKDEKAAFALCESISLKELKTVTATALKEAHLCFNRVEIVRLTLAIIAVNDCIYKSPAQLPS